LVNLKNEAVCKMRFQNFFGIPKSFDIGRSSENVLGKFRKFGSWFLECAGTESTRLEIFGDVTHRWTF